MIDLARVAERIPPTLCPGGWRGAAEPRGRPDRAAPEAEQGRVEEDLVLFAAADGCLRAAERSCEPNRG